ncbi:MAG: hypothetical protein D6706_11500 [Chloroflexi bacterium]|nr:MAG: hypothetical protein D6706_11500 [Chloroflexota bacterium]
MSEVETGRELNETGRESAVFPRRSRRWLRRLGLLLVVISALLGWYFLVAYLGWQAGQAALQEKQQTQLAQQLARQVVLAREDAGKGNYVLALRRLEWVLERDPDNVDALALQEQVLAAMETAVTPEPDITPTPTKPTATPVPTVTPGPIGDPATELARIEELMTAEAWEDAIKALITFQRQLPNYERHKTDQMLYDAYISLGLELVNTERVELGLFYLEQAEQLGDLPQSVEDYRIWADLYLQGLAFWGVNWGAAAFYFRDLCLAAPFYQSACDRLFEVLVNLADQYAVAQDWCQAEAFYTEAQQYGNSVALGQKLTEAQEQCLLATPTPVIPEGTEPITGTQGITNTFSLPLPSFTPTATPRP